MVASYERILAYFAYQHLPQGLQQVSKPICDIAHAYAELMQDSNDPDEVAVGLRKLLEAKDCFVRAKLK